MLYPFQAAARLAWTSLVSFSFQRPEEMCNAILPYLFGAPPGHSVLDRRGRRNEVVEKLILLD